MISPDRRVPGSRKSGTRLLLLSTLALAGCTDAAGYDLDYILAKAPFIATMRGTVAYEPQALPRLPAAGSVPIVSPNGEMLPVFGQAQLDSAAATLTNPLSPTPEVLARGAVVYRNQCFSCHGAQGEGNGPVVGGGRFPLGPPLNSGAAAARSDGYVYAVVRVGRGLMPSYGDRISHNDRWAVALYVRQLQQQAGAVAPQPALQPGITQPAVGQAPLPAPGAAPGPGATQPAGPTPGAAGADTGQASGLPGGPPPAGTQLPQ